jgi:Flp pilus assembly protein TadD
VAEMSADESALSASSQQLFMLGGSGDMAEAEARAESMREKRGMLLHVMQTWAPSAADSSLAEALCAILDDVPQEHLLHELLARYHVGRDEYEQAVVQYERFLSFKPKSVEGQQGLAMVYEKTGRLDEALLMHRRAVEGNLGSDRAYGPAIRLADRTGKLEALARRWELLYRAHKDEEVLRRNLIYLWNRLGRNDKVVALVGSTGVAAAGGGTRGN